MNPENEYLTDFTEQVNFGYTLAAPLDRLGATIVEGVIIYVPLYFIVGENSSFFSTDNLDVESFLFQIGLSILLGSIFYSQWSGNLGHKLLGMKVVSSIDGTDQKKALAGAIREGLKNILGLLILPSIWLLWDTKKQNLYDKITNTLVVKNLKKVK